MKRLCIIVSILVVAVLLTPGEMGRHPSPHAARLETATPPAQQAPRQNQQPYRTAPARPIEPRPLEGTSTYAKLALEFEANRGQAAAQYGFVAHGPTYALGISSDEIALSLHRPQEGSKGDLVSPALNRIGSGLASPREHFQLHLRLLGANRSSVVTGLDPKPGLSNYFIGNDPAKWQTHVPHFGRVRMGGVYPGIDLIFYGNPQQLEYDFQVAPGADPTTIRLTAHDAASAALDRDGDVVLGTAAGDVRLRHPQAYQEIDGSRRPVESRFRMASGSTLRFEVGAYDHSKALIIDPVLIYSAAIGGNNGNQAYGVDVDAAGNSYVTGNTCSTDFPSTAGGFERFQNDVPGFACQNAYVLKLDPTGSSLIYSDYVGGSGASTGTHLAVDASGNAFVTGLTTSTDFPLIGNVGPATTEPCALFTSFGTNCPDGFIFKLAPDGGSMLFSSLLGGSQTDLGFQVKLNPVSGDVVVLGETDSSDFLPALTTLQTTYEGGTCANNTPCLNAFLVGLDSATGALRYGTFLGGAGDSFAAGLAFDASGNAYVAGSTDIPLSSSLGAATHIYPPAEADAAGGMDIFVAQLKLNKSSLSLGYLTLIEGESDDVPGAVAVDSSGNAYLTGTTASEHLPVTSGVYQTTNNANGDAGCILGFTFPPVSCGTTFVARLDPTGALSFLTYLGGSGTDWGEAIGVDAPGNIWLAGATVSSDFPFTDGASQPTGGSSSYNRIPYLAEMSGDGKALSFAWPIAGNLGAAKDIKIDSSNNVYVVGQALSVTTTPGTYFENFSALGANPLFVQKWNAGASPAIQLSTNAITFPGTAVGALSAPQTVTVKNTGAGTLQLGIRLVSSIYGAPADSVPPDFMEFNNCGVSLAAGASCTITLEFEPLAPPAPCTTANGCYPQSPTAELIIQTNAPTGTQTVSLSGVLGQGPVFSAIPDPIVFPAQTAGDASQAASQATQVNINNMGDINLLISNVSISGANASEFQITQDSQVPCMGPVSSVCALFVTFSPAASATGTRTATLNITDNAVDSPQSIPITATVATPAPGLVIFPTSAMLGPTAIGSTVNPNNCIGCAFFTATNPSSAASIEITALTFGGANKDDFQYYIYPPLPATIAPGGDTSFEVYFEPVSGVHGLRQATLTLTTDPSISGLPVIQLQGQAVTNSDPSLYYFSNPSPLDFGSMQVGQSSAIGSNFLQIVNTGPRPCAGGASSCGGPLVVSSIVAGLSDYTLSVTPYSSANSYCTLPPLTLPAGAGCDFAVTFAPIQAGSRNTTLTINSNDLSGPATLPVMGAGLAVPLGDLSVTALDFGYDAIGVASPQLTVTLENTGASSLSILGATASANFSVASNSCTAHVAPGASCMIGVTFTPPSAGGFSGTLTISDNDDLDGTQVVALSGIGAPGASLLLRPATINFGNQIVNNLSAAQAVTISNSGDTAIAFPANAFRASADFILQNTTCGASLPEGASCVVNVQFKPSVTYLESGILTLTDNARGNPQMIFLAGTGVQGGANKTMTSLMSSANPAITGQSITFTAIVSAATTNTPVPTGSVTFLDGATTLGSGTLNSSAQGIFTTSSLSAGSHSITAVYSSDANYAASTSSVLTEVVSAPARVDTRTTLAALPNPATAGEKVTLTASVSPVSGNAVPTGTVMFYDGGTSLGTGTLSAGSATFSTGGLAVGSHSITASYGGDAGNASSTSAAVSETITAPIPLVSTTTLTSSSASIASGSSVTLTAMVTPPSGTATVPTGKVTFLNGTTTLGTGTLNATGAATYATPALPVGTDSITARYSGDSVFAASTSVAVSVVVGTPNFSLSLNPAIVSIASGGSGSTTISATSAFGFASAISFTCSGLPEYATCTFSPATLTPNGSAASTTTLTIATNVATALLRKDLPTSRRSGRAPLFCIVLLGAIGLLRATRQGRGLFREVRNLALLAFLLLTLAGAVLIGCGGSSTNTPSGSSTVTVTANGGGQTQTTTLSVTVQ